MSEEELGIIEAAAQVICDAGSGRKWRDIGQAFRDVYRARARALHAAGLLRKVND